jgi:hypothetical protein
MCLINSENSQPTDERAKVDKIIIFGGIIVPVKRSE